MDRQVSVLSVSLVLAAGLLVALASVTATAGTITGWTASTGGVGTAQVFLPANVNPNNDNSTAPGDNLTIAVKRLDNSGPIDIDFTVADSDGVTEYEIVEFVDNNTGVPWSSYFFQLIPATANDGLDFDTPDMDPVPTSSAFSSVVQLEDQLTFSVGTHGSGAESYMIRLDVPDGIDRFTLRQTPIAIPEPGTLVLAAWIGLALSAVGLRKRRG